jgi:hypothetical protein
MRGYYEVRAQGPGREQFRLFCILENAQPVPSNAANAPSFWFTPWTLNSD